MRRREGRTGPQLNWARQDLEQRLLFNGGRYTRVNGLLSGLIGILLAVVFYAVLATTPLAKSAVGLIFLERGPTQHAVVVLFFWSLAILVFKRSKLGLQRQALDVLGLSQAIGSFTAVLGTGEDVSAITGALGKVTAGLATAFDTTLVALVAALILQLVMVMTKKSEEEFLDESMEYGMRNIVGRLRLESLGEEA